MADIRRYHSEHTDNNNNNTQTVQLQKMSGNSGSIQGNYDSDENTEVDDQSESDEERTKRHKRRKLERTKGRKAAKAKKRIEQSAPTGDPIKEKDKSHKGMTTEIKESIKKVQNLKKSKPLWNTDDKSEWINKADKTGFVCENCKGLRYEFTHPTHRCGVKVGKMTPTGRVNNSPYIFDNTFDYESWAKGEEGK
jgi:hypothetical protein